MGEMKWHNGVLHIRIESQYNGQWMPYTAFPLLKVPDYGVPGESKGWATYQRLFKAGWPLMPSKPDYS